MFSRLACLLTGVYAGVVADQMWKKHKVLETWAPGQAWEKARVRFQERLKLWSSRHRPSGFGWKSITSDSENADEDSKMFTEMPSGERGYNSAGDQGSEDQGRATMDRAPAIEEIFQDKIKIWKAKSPEVQGMMEEKIKLIKERAPVIQGLVEEKVRVLKESSPEITEKLHDKIKEWKDKAPEVKEELLKKIRAAKEHAVAGGEAVSERVAIFKEASSRGKDVVEERVEALGGDVEKAKEINEGSNTNEEIVEVEEVLEESGNASSKRKTSMLGDTEGKRDGFKANSLKIKDGFKAKGSKLKDKSPVFKEVIVERESFMGNYPELKEVLEEKEKVSDISPDIKNIEKREKVFGQGNFENNEMLDENVKFSKGSLSQLEEKKDMTQTFKESLHDSKENEKESGDIINQYADIFRENNEVGKEVPLDVTRKIENEQNNMEEKDMTGKKEVINERANDVKKMLQENMKTLKRAAPEITEILRGKMNSLKETAPEISELLKGKINALKRKFRRAESTNEQTQEPNVESKHEQGDTTRVEPNDEVKGEPKRPASAT